MVWHERLENPKPRLHIVPI